MSGAPPNRLPDLFQGLWRGLAGGLAGAVLGHALVTLCLRCGGAGWLKGSYGPASPSFHFFDIALYLSCVFACIGYALSLRLHAALAGCGAAFLAISLPMSVLTRIPQTQGWDWVVLVACADILAVQGTTLLLGALLCPGRRLRGALFAFLGIEAGYLSLWLLQRLVPPAALGHWSPASFVPAPLDLLTWLLAGLGMGAGIFLAGRRSDEEIAQA